MIKNLVLILTALSLTSCGGYGKVKNIIDFTPQLQPEDSGHKVSLSPAEHAKQWNEGVNWINVQPSNFATSEVVGALSRKKSYKRIIAAPIIVDGKIFVLSEDATLSAIDARSYKSLWSNHLNAKSDSRSFSGGGLLSTGGKIFITHGTRDVIVLDASDGRELWRRTLPDISKAQPVLYDNLLLVLTISNQLCALNVHTGQLVWQHDGLPEVLSYDKGVAPIARDGRVFVCYSSGELVILDASNGEEVWQLNLARENDGSPGFSTLGIESQPIIDGDNIYIASSSGALMKLNIKTGYIYWKRKLSDIQSMNKSGNTIFLTTNAKQVAALNERTGLVIWVTDLSVEGAQTKKSYKPVQFLTPVVLNNNLVVISSDGKMRVISGDTGLVEKVIGLDVGASFIAIDDDLTVFTKTSILKRK
jgi:outer membrane protein assembly factor BamB